LRWFGRDDKFDAICELAGSTVTRPDRISKALGIVAQLIEPLLKLLMSSHVSWAFKGHESERAGLVGAIHCPTLNGHSADLAIVDRRAVCVDHDRLTLPSEHRPDDHAEEKLNRPETFL
jgi:hypothetical protein